MKKTNLKFTSLVLAILVLVSSFSMSAFADDSVASDTVVVTESGEVDPGEVSVEEPGEEPAPEITHKETKSVREGYNALLGEFTVKKSDCGMKYAYYSPVADENDTTKYPLVIYVHGRFHGWTDKTFVKSGLVYWCSTEMQQSFEAKGAHLLMPKLSEFMLSSAQTDSVYKVIQQYIDENSDNIDTNKILVMGGSAGGGVAWKLMIDHPELFSAGVTLCATKMPTASEIKKMSETPVWVVSAKTDPLINFLANQTITWSQLCSSTNVREQCRWSVFNGRVTLPDGSHPGISHFLAKTIGYNLCSISDGSSLPSNTVNGNGDSIQLDFDNGIIEWFENVSSCNSEGM